MNRTKLEKTGSYRAKDAAGIVHAIDVYTEFFEITTLMDKVEKWQPGMKSHKMASTGGHVTVNEDGTLEEIATGRTMTRV